MKYSFIIVYNHNVNYNILFIRFYFVNKKNMKFAYKDWSLEYILEWDTIFVLSIFVDERRQWTATQLMNMLLERAKEEEVNVIELPVMSFDPEEWMETEELKNRFERIWFEIVEKYSIWDNKWYAMKMEL